jgi:hypothetical protein
MEEIYRTPKDYGTIECYQSQRIERNFRKNSIQNSK